MKCSWDDTFGVLLDKLDLPETTRTDKVQIAKFSDPVHVVPIDAPVSICDQFKCMHVCISVKMQTTGMTSRNASLPNAFDVLMASSREIVLTIFMKYLMIFIFLFLLFPCPQVKIGN